MEPTTMIAVAQAGVQLYSMFRSSGGGIGKILAAQTRMLTEVGAQLGVIHQQLDAIHRAIGDLRDAVRQAPRDNALELIETLLKGSFIDVNEILRARAQHEREGGMVYAIAMVEREATALADTLRKERSTLISDGSVTLCPFVAAAWFMELQLRGSCMPFNEVRIEEAARTYGETFARWQRDEIFPMQKSLNEAAAAMHKAIEASQRYNGHDCYHSIAIDEKVHVHHRGGEAAEHWETSTYSVIGTRSQIVAQPSRVRASLAAYSDELRLLADAGIDIGRPFFAIEPLHWTTKETPTPRGFGENRRAADAHLAALKKNACKEAPGFGPKFVQRENQHEAKANSEALFARAVVYGHFSLICREAEASVRALHERAGAR